MLIIPVILSGGVGSRLWPLSREAHPKPFIKLADGESLLQKTYRRAIAVINSKEVITVTNRNFLFYTKDEYEGINDDVYNTYLLEPVGRNSTAAIAVAANYAKEKYGPDAILLILPADHLIQDVESFKAAVSEASELASKEKLVTFGIQPTSPQTGFGYIEASGNEVRQFVEKPDYKTAEKYLVSGNFFWNSGMFCMSAGSFLKELQNFHNDIAIKSSECIRAACKADGKGFSQYELDQNLFGKIEDISVDYAVFEKSKRVAIVPCDIGWSDIGSWSDFGALIDSDEKNNNLQGEVVLEDSNNCVVHGGSKLIAGLGIKDLIIADTSDALLIAQKDRVQDVRKIVKKLKDANHPTYKEFPTVYRPWGSYTVLQEGFGFKLKLIEVKPGGRLSLQSHKQRSEHWVVVQGAASITNGDDYIELQINQSTYIPIGNKHRLENKGKEILIVVEVQCGGYLGEDDIIRYDDIYGRAK